jgi:hypothetical protein
LFKLLSIFFSAKVRIIFGLPSLFPDFFEKFVRVVRVDNPRSQNFPKQCQQLNIPSPHLQTNFQRVFTQNIDSRLANGFKVMNDKEIQRESIIFTDSH